MSYPPASAPPRVRGAARSLRRLSISLLTASAALIASVAGAQTGSISGTVTSAASGNPIPAAQVIVVGTTQGATTDSRGAFRLGGLSGDNINIEVRRIGFRPVRQTVRAGLTGIQITMTEQSVALDEVVITGTPGGQALRELGNAVTTVNAA